MLTTRPAFAALALTVAVAGSPAHAEPGGAAETDVGSVLTLSLADAIAMGMLALLANSINVRWLPAVPNTASTLSDGSNNSGT